MMHELTGYPMTAPLKPMMATRLETPPLQPDQVIIEVAGCGVCHTDLGFYEGKVKTKMALPLILGHEISGKVVATGREVANLQGNTVIVPAVIPCGRCDLCRRDLANLCREQVMPGNDIHGGFATHVVVPGRFLHVIDQARGTHRLADLSVVADAVTTPYQSMLQAEVGKGDFVVVIGVGGIGTYGVQIAHALGAKVAAIDVDEEKLERIRKFGADAVFNPKSLEPGAFKKAIGKEAPSPHGWKVFEMSGTLSGQMLAFSLLTFAGVLGIVGFTMEKGEFRLSNLMAFGARAFGNWGCHPRHYGAALQMVMKGEIQLQPFIKYYPLREINHVFELAEKGQLKERPILIP